MESTKPHADASGARDFENRFVVACPCALKKKKTVNIMSEEDFVKQPFLKLYAKHKGNTTGKQPFLNLYAKPKGNTNGIQKHMLTKVGHGILKR